MIVWLKDVKSFQPKCETSRDTRRETSEEARETSTGTSGDKCSKKGDEQGDKWDSVKPLGQECLSREQAKRQAETSVKAYPEQAETSEARRETSRERSVNWQRDPEGDKRKSMQPEHPESVLETRRDKWETSAKACSQSTQSVLETGRDKGKASQSTGDKGDKWETSVQSRGQSSRVYWRQEDEGDK